MSNYIMSRDIEVASFDNDFNNFKVLNENLCPIFLLRTKNVKAWLSERVIDGSRRSSRALKKIFGLSSFAEDDVTALVMNAATITDNFWIKKEDSNLTYSDICYKENDLFMQALDGASVKDLLEKKPSRTPELNNMGCQEKGWKLEEDGWWLYKNQRNEETISEMITFKIGKLLSFDMAEYELANEGKYIKTKDFTEGKYNLQHINCIMHDHDGMTDEDYSYNYTTLKGINPKLAEEYLNIICLDAICHNVDRHTRNYGLITSREDGRILKLAPNYDNNESLGSYGNISYRGSDKLLDMFVELLHEQGISYNLPALKYEDVLNVVEESDVFGIYDSRELSDYIMFRYGFIENKLTER